MILIPLITPLHVLSSDINHIWARCHKVVWFSALFRMSWYARFMISGLFLHQAVIVHIISYTSYYPNVHSEKIEEKKLYNSRNGMISDTGICNTNYKLK